MNERLSVSSLSILMVRGEGRSACSLCESWIEVLGRIPGFSELMGSEFVLQINTTPPDLVLLCESSGASPLLNKMRRWLPWVPIVVLSHAPTVEQAVNWMKLGASDYLGFPTQKGEISSFLLNVMNSQGVQDHLSFRDEVTGLFNQQYLQVYLQELIAESSQQGLSFGVLFLDLNQFKLINDSYGHRRGTELLCELGVQMKRSVRATDRVFRYGGDEFVVVLASLEASAGAQIAARLKASLESYFYLQRRGLKIQIQVSLGLSLFPEHGSSLSELIEAADQAMYREKRGLGMSEIIPGSDQRDRSWNRKSRVDRNISSL